MPTSLVHKVSFKKNNSSDSTAATYYDKTIHTYIFESFINVLNTKKPSLSEQMKACVKSQTTFNQWSTNKVCLMILFFLLRKKWIKLCRWVMGHDNQQQLHYLRSCWLYYLGASRTPLTTYILCSFCFSLSRSISLSFCNISWWTHARAHASFECNWSRAYH